MAIVIDATAGGATANSYVTLAEANAYMEAHADAETWEDADVPAALLIEAARDLQTARWRGLRATATQMLAWPRADCPDPDAAWGTAFPVYDTDVIPQRVKDAQCEIALAYVRDGKSPFARAAEPQVRRKRVDVLDTEYFEPAQPVTGWRLLPRVTALIGPLMAGQSGVVVRVERG
jgi:hypothetical protein